VAQREDLDLLGAVTAPEQDEELEDTAEDEVQQGPGHEQRGCPLPEDAQAINSQVNSIDPGFRTPQGGHERPLLVGRQRAGQMGGQVLDDDTGTAGR
jgi:hypothetical protein